MLMGHSFAERESPMSTVEEITAAIEESPVARVRDWLAEFAERLWDEEIERDERAGRLDALIDKARRSTGPVGLAPCESPHHRRLLGIADARLPEAVQRVADRHYALLRADPRHPSLHFKKVGRLWSVRAGAGYRALAAEAPDGLVWFWIGPHDEYERVLANA